ncbi:MAG: hypothetical protein ACHQFW_01390 [Chitinophagales bacterium]
MGPKTNKVPSLHKPQTVLVMIILGLIGFCIPVFAIYGIEFNEAFSKSIRIFLETHKETMYWFLMITLKMCIYGFLIIPIIYLYNEVIKIYKPIWNQYGNKNSKALQFGKLIILPLISIFLAAAIRKNALVHLGDDDYYFWHIMVTKGQPFIDPNTYHMIITYIGVALIIGCISLMLFIYIISTTNEKSMNEKSLQILNKHLDLTMVFMGVIIGFASLARAQLRDAYLEFPFNPTDAYPIDIVYVNGMINTLMIAIFYVPIKLSVVYNRNNLFSSISDPEKENPEDNTTFAFLNKLINSLKILIPLFAPFWGSLLPSFLG